ncbi:cGMP-dependent protein kinase [Aureococcus anophagefferens]|nr:cGMP-dependent protein kinase [Aureococcus anophagefferens]
MTRGAVRCALLLACAAADEWWRPLARAQRLPRSCDAVPLPDAWAGAFERAPDAALPAFVRRRGPLRPLGARSTNCSALANRETADLGPFRRRAGARAARRSVVVLGGSMTAGHMNASTRSRCEAEPDFAGYGYNLDNRACALPRRFRAWLRHAYPGAAHEVENWAIGGSTSASVVGRLSSALSGRRVDVFFVNYVDNDQARRDAGAAGFEILLRLLRLARAAVVDLELALPAGALAYAPHAAACDALAVPALVGAVLAGRAAPRALARAAAERLRRRGAARRGEAAGVARDGWRVADDAPGKRGWARAAGAAITFAVEATAVYGVAFLASWDPTMGRVAAALDGGPPVVLDARRPNSTVSLTEYRRICSPAHDHPDFPRCDARVPSPFVPPPGPRREAALELAGLAAANVKDRYAAEDELKRARAPPGTKWWAWRDPALVRRNLTFVLLDPGTRFVIRYLTTC